MEKVFNLDYETVYRSENGWRSREDESQHTKLSSNSLKRIKPSKYGSCSL